MDRNSIYQIIVDCAREVAPDLAGHVFQPGDSLKELGLDSVERSEVVVMALEALHLKVSAVEVFGPRNIGELADVLFEKHRSN